MGQRPTMLPAAICAAFCANCASAGSDSALRVLSYNIHHGAGMDGKLDLGRIAEVIKSASPDIVSLQETDSQTKRSGGIDQAKELGRLTDMEFAFGASMSFQGGKYGNAVLTSLPIKESKVVPLPGEPRSALCVTLKLPGNGTSNEEFLFIATHLDTRDKPRLDSVALIEKVMESRPGIPAILAGDLNASPVSPTMQGLGKTWTNATSQEGLFTYPASKPSKQIDYILHRPCGSWAVRETKVLGESIASDHRPILAVLQFLSEPKDRNGEATDKRDASNGK